MRYFKNNDNDISAYDDDVVIDIDETITEITEAEAKAIANPPATDVEIFAHNVAVKTDDITTAFNAAAEAISNALPHEMASWRKQEDEARAYLADNSVPTPALSALVVARDKGETVFELATKVVVNADTYASVYFPLLGKFQNKMSEITLTKTTADLTAIKF